MYTYHFCHLVYLYEKDEAHPDYFHLRILFQGAGCIRVWVNFGNTRVLLTVEDISIKSYRI